MKYRDYSITLQSRCFILCDSTYYSMTSNIILAPNLKLF